MTSAYNDPFADLALPETPRGLNKAPEFEAAPAPFQPDFQAAAAPVASFQAPAASFQVSFQAPSAPFQAPAASLHGTTGAGPFQSYQAPVLAPPVGSAPSSARVSPMLAPVAIPAFPADMGAFSLNPSNAALARAVSPPRHPHAPSAAHVLLPSALAPPTSGSRQPSRAPSPAPDFNAASLSTPPGPGSSRASPSLASSVSNPFNSPPFSLSSDPFSSESDSARTMAAPAPALTGGADIERLRAHVASLQRQLEQEKTNHREEVVRLRESHDGDLNTLRAKFADWAERRKKDYLALQEKYKQALQAGGDSTQLENLKGQLSNAQLKVVNLETRASQLEAELAQQTNLRQQEQQQYEAAIQAAKSASTSTRLETAESDFSVKLDSTQPAMVGRPIKVTCSSEEDFKVQWLRATKGSNFVPIEGTVCNFLCWCFYDFRRVCASPIVVVHSAMVS